MEKKMVIWKIKHLSLVENNTTFHQKITPSFVGPELYTDFLQVLTWEFFFLWEGDHERQDYNAYSTMISFFFTDPTLSAPNWILHPRSQAWLDHFWIPMEWGGGISPGDGFYPSTTYTYRLRSEFQRTTLVNRLPWRLPCRRPSSRRWSERARKAGQIKITTKKILYSRCRAASSLLIK